MLPWLHVWHATIVIVQHAFAPLLEPKPLHGSRMPPAERGNLYLDHGEADSCQFLVDLRTADRVQLPEGSWRLGFLDDGQGILLPLNGEPCWAAEQLTRKLEDVGGCLGVSVHGVQYKYKDFMAHHSPKQVALHPVGSEPYLVDAAVFEKANAGAVAWWSLPSLHERLALPGTPAAWYHRKWLAWDMWLTSLGFPMPHFRRSVETKPLSTAVSPRPVVDDAASWRALPYYAASSFALVALLVRLSSTKWERLVDKGRAACFGSGMAAIIKTFAPRAADVEVFMYDVVCAPGIKLSGDSPLHMKLVDGIVDLEGMLTSSVNECRRWCEALCLDVVGSRWELQNLLLAVHGAGGQLSTLFKQLVHILGSWVDDGAKQHQCEATSSSGPQAARHQCGGPAASHTMASHASSRCKK